MLRFFNKNRVEDIPFIGSGAIEAHVARKSSAYDSMTEVQYAWLHRVKKVAEQMSCPPYSPEKLEAEMPSTRSLRGKPRILQKGM